MDPQSQDVLLCDFCKDIPLQSHCELCHINLCINCVGKHLLDSSRKHRVVPYTERGYTPDYPKCQRHGVKHCELYCENCDIPVCPSCLSSSKHEGHKLSDILEKLDSKKQGIEKDLEELETIIFPRYQKIASDVQIEKANIETNYGKLTTAADQQGEVWHQEITTIVEQQKSDIEEMKNQHLAVLDEHTNQITQSISEIKQAILDLKTLLETNNIAFTSIYNSKNSEFKRLPPKVQVILPSLCCPTVDTEGLHKMFGSLSSLSITKEHGYTLLDEPQLTESMDPEFYTPRNVTCLGDEKVWTSGEDKIIKLRNLQGKLLKSIQTESENAPRDIAITRGGDLIYTDPKTRTVNIVKNKKIQTMIRLQGWEPLNICNTSSGDLLVTMNSDDGKSSKVVRYSDSTETQTIQFDDQGQPLYSSGAYVNYISENRNLDICVADNGAKEIVVVTDLGRLRFRYTGHPSDTEGSFDPVGITTDSQSQILTADCNKHCIHILDQDGQFLRYIDNCGLRWPWGLCVDSRDNLFVAECDTGKVKKIQYL
ncbi:uncharacterized protein LOC125680684 [Ostrea edulis]|uniref:uncharacterized protein LOC125680684 n=1 Tax=Ostrea edulis TaxID=37623 RepID=UPI0024AF4719|nr:uncharacterized protein LOC125680684 [Ostrea edulis]